MQNWKSVEGWLVSMDVNDKELQIFGESCKDVKSKLTIMYTQTSQRVTKIHAAHRVLSVVKPGYHPAYMSPKNISALQKQQNLQFAQLINDHCQSLGMKVGSTFEPVRKISYGR